MPQTNIDITWRANYVLKQPPQPRELVLLLHGFQQSGETLARLLAEALPEDVAVLAPDGLFPIPVRTPKGYELGFTWYFFDPIRQIYHRDMSAALAYLETLLQALQLPGSLPMRVIGYSQGAYLAPHAAACWSQVIQVIGINGRFRSEVIKSALPFRIDGVHGAIDDQVDPQRSQRCFEELQEHGCHGSFTLVPGSGHGISGDIRRKVSQLLSLREPQNR